MNCTSKRAHIALVAALVVAGGLVGPVHAGNRKVLRAKINGRPFRVGGRLAIGSTNGLGAIVITGNKFSLRTRSQKSLTLGCTVPGLQAGEQNPNDPPAPIEKGKVSVDLLGG